MRVLLLDKKNSALKLIPEVKDDLWHLERILERGDLVSGATDRKIKPRAEGEKHIRVKLFLTVEAEKIDFNRETGNLRVTGAIRGGKPADLVELGASHSIEIPLGKAVRIEKKELKGFQIERLERARRATEQGKLLLVVLDDEQADFALLREFELERRGTIRSGREGKRFESTAGKGAFFKRVIERAKEIKPDAVIFAGPGFTKDSLKKWLEEKGEKGNFHFASTNSVGITGLNELVKGKAIEGIVRETQIAKDTRLVEALLKELGQESGLAEYGAAEVKKAVECGAVKELLLCDSFLLGHREEAEELLNPTEQMGGKVHLVDSRNEAGKKLLSLGGVAAILRFKVR
jgi:protein pelota